MLAMQTSFGDFRGEAGICGVSTIRGFAHPYRWCTLIGSIWVQDEGSGQRNRWVSR
jgi:hypothetical protein